MAFVVFAGSVEVEVNRSAALAFSARQTNDEMLRRYLAATAIQEFTGIPKNVAETG